MACPQTTSVDPDCEKILREKISEKGSLTVAEYVGLANAHYYATRDPLGREGDFTTAPEISQLFGEILALAMIETWQKAGSPKAFTLAELGPGRGTLMADFLRTARLVPDFLHAAKGAFVETSPVLQDKQKAAVGAYENDCSFIWYRDIGSLLKLERPLFLIANEFLDALPFHQYRKKGKAWEEKIVVLSGEEDVLSWSWRALSEAESQDLAGSQENVSLSTEEVIEDSPQRRLFFHKVTNHLQRFGGGAFFIDYGDRGLKGDTFQAVKNHHYVPVLATPGEADLTSHVDFGVLEGVIRHLNQPPQSPKTLGESFPASPLKILTSTFETQRQFLKRYYGDLRLQGLLRKATPSQKEALISGYERLTSPAQMGTLFKVLSVNCA